MSNDIKLISARVRQSHRSGLHGDFTAIIEANLSRQFEELENTEGSADMLRLQGGIRALRQLLTDIKPRNGE